jgi:serine/threonine-protein kinase
VALPANDKEIAALVTTLSESFARDSSSTIVPARARTAHAFLEKLRERGPAIELRTGKTIGAGGMGVVHEAEQVALGRIVAVKTLKHADDAAAQDLLREAWVTGALEHPNVVPIHHLEMGDAPLLVMKRVDGIEWSKLVRDAEEVEHRFGTSDLLGWNLDILNQVLNALRFAHSRGIIHRDLKPANVMIGNFGEVYLLDWGIAVSVGDDDRFPLARDVEDVAGTPAYMAPEMLGPNVGIPLGVHTDVYVAGAVLFELVVGRPPHVGTNAAAIVASIVMSDPILPASVPAELAAICRRAVRPAPSERYASITELQQALRRYIEHRGSAQLAARATESLNELVALCAGEPSDGQRESIYRTLAICRFGFHEALAAWRENADARDGVTRATVAVAEYELRAGAPRNAVTLLSELEDRHALLDTAQAAAAESAKRQEKLEKLEAAQDPRPGQALRWRLAVLLGGVFTISPLVSGLAPSTSGTTHLSQQLITLGAMLAVVLTGWIWRRRTRTAIPNRTVIQSAILMFTAQLVLLGGAERLGLGVRESQALMLFLWATIAGMLAISFDRGFVLPSLAYFVGFLVAARSPQLVPYVMACSNGLFTIVVAVRWRSAAERVPLSMS